MKNDCEELGQLIQKTREEGIFSLREIESSTSIRVKYLEAIEKGKLLDFLSGVYALGFLKRYAEFLGMDVEELMKQYPKAFQLKTEGHHFAFGIGTLEPRGSLGGGIKWVPYFLWALSITLILILGYYFMKILGVL